MATKEDFLKAVQELRKQEEARAEKINFNQTVDLVINLREFDVKKTPINLFLNLPHKFKEKKVAAFLEKKSSVIDTITKAEFEDFKDKKKLRKVVKAYDFFIANAKLMPSVATTFGRVLGPVGKMPSPQLGVLMEEKEEKIKELLSRVDSLVKIRTKEPTIKVAIGKQTNKDSELSDNAFAIYSEVFKNLPRNNENLRSILIKFTMSKPIKVKIK
jgi:large subunit ribosomal protein L1